jgi:hypothetical protein
MLVNRLHNDEIHGRGGIWRWIAKGAVTAVAVAGFSTAAVSGAFAQEGPIITPTVSGTGAGGPVVGGIAVDVPTAPTDTVGGGVLLVPIDDDNDRGRNDNDGGRDDDFDFGLRDVLKLEVLETLLAR